ncbi:hypothetical protein Ga0074812_1635 [Parafrankia irregularis]|uniref:Phosphotransacetylase n=1 Tax=Parafrankia irregularis TaxID=795642 RepID=A0A0S4R2F4_9ACTN|nr:MULTISPECIES: DUF6758 family protein [Parafrankia]MBE3205151.1 phosphotransacetylase [Parafrankia sp. CH37]CUU61208.1 hypothetical protein Ga0074812_1635 [Parafrankia irregularis]
MTAPPVCPACLGPLDPPDVWSDRWRCGRHGDVEPFHEAQSSREALLRSLGRTSQVPVWLPSPMPVHWFASGVGWAGDDRSGAHATALSTSGPSPVGGPAEMVLVAEAPRIGLGARLAGLSGSDPARLDAAPEAKVEAAGHPTALWPVTTPPDRAAFVGEALGVWLWCVLWPADAALLLLEQLVIEDMRDDATLVDHLLFGAPGSHLSSL